MKDDLFIHELAITYLVRSPPPKNTRAVPRVQFVAIILRLHTLPAVMSATRPSSNRRLSHPLVDSTDTVTLYIIIIES